MSQADQSSSRWWEFYAVRYGMGSVVGAVIFFFLCSTNPVLKPMLFGAGAGKIDGTLLALLAGYGLAYCYIASAPILVLHVGRFLLDIGKSSKTPHWQAILLFLPPLTATIVFFLTRSMSGTPLYFYSSVFALTSLIFWPQYLAIGVTLFKSKDLFAFYQKLANKRSAAKGGIVDSYKHMREHGNSYSIVVLEILLAIILFTAGNFETFSTGVVSTSKDIYIIPYIAIIMGWIFPAALVWLVGTLFERQFSAV